MQNETNSAMSIFSAHEANSSEGWVAHPTCPGVLLKHLVRGTDNGGSCSLSLVRIDPGCEIATHRHEGRSEVHHVLRGSGACHMGERLAYSEGTMAHIPPQAEHRVVAGPEGLSLVAIFAPALF